MENKILWIIPIAILIIALLPLILVEEFRRNIIFNFVMACKYHPIIMKILGIIIGCLIGASLGVYVAKLIIL